MVEIINKDIFKGVAGKRSGKPKGVVIHNDAGSKNATAKWYMTTFLPDRVKAKQSNLGFAHYYIDRNTIGRCENTNNKAWHTANSDGNANYIGYEVCQSVGESEANFKENEEMTFRQVAEDLQFYGLKANRDTIKLHKQFTSTSCPHRSVSLHGDNTKVQDYFISRVNHYIRLGKTVNDMLKKQNIKVEPAKTTAKNPDKRSKKFNVNDRVRLTSSAKKWKGSSDFTLDSFKSEYIVNWLNADGTVYIKPVGADWGGNVLESDIEHARNNDIDKDDIIKLRDKATHWVGGSKLSDGMKKVEYSVRERINGNTLYIDNGTFRGIVYDWDAVKK